MNKTRTTGNLAVIPARGGSKRIPRKNIVEFGGRPLLAWTIQAAIESSLFERVVVSTDDDEIADVARQYGAEVPFLRDQFADDHATASDVTRYVLDELERRTGAQFLNVVQLMPNCPLRKGQDLVRAWQTFDEQPDAALLSCFPFGWMNPWWAMTLDGRGHPTPLFPEMLKQRSQDLPQLYCPSGAIWISSTARLREYGTFYSPEYRLFPMNWRAAVDIDDEEDLAMAQAALLLDSETDSVQERRVLHEDR